jgi:hypothetical protein
MDGSTDVGAPIVGWFIIENRENPNYLTASDPHPDTLF